MPWDIIFKSLGVIGLLAIISGLLVRTKRAQYIVSIIGGSCLTAYSIYLGDWIFIVLQVVFTVVAVYQFWSLKYERGNKKAGAPIVQPATNTHGK